MIHYIKFISGNKMPAFITIYYHSRCKITTLLHCDLQAKRLIYLRQLTAPFYLSHRINTEDVLEKKTFKLCCLLFGVMNSKNAIPQERKCCITLKSIACIFSLLCKFTFSLSHLRQWKQSKLVHE